MTNSLRMYGPIGPYIMQYIALCHILQSANCLISFLCLFLYTLTVTKTFTVNIHTGEYNQDSTAESTDNLSVRR